SITGAVSAKNVDQTAGIADGAGTLTADTFTWTGGNQAGPGSTRINNTLTMSGPNYTIDGRTLSNLATSQASWTSGTIFGANGAKIENDGLFINSFDGSA